MQEAGRGWILTDYLGVGDAFARTFAREGFIRPAVACGLRTDVAGLGVRRGRDVRDTGLCRAGGVGSGDGDSGFV